ncbi:hypothetical protein Tco_0281267 [Tanacetum coccineum]
MNSFALSLDLDLVWAFGIVRDYGFGYDLGHHSRTKEEVQEILKTSSGYDPDDELLTPDDGPVSGLGGSSNS